MGGWVGGRTLLRPTVRATPAPRAAPHNRVAPGLPLQAIGIGKPGCMLNFDLANAIGPFSFASAGTALSLQTGTVTPSLVGLQCWSQALTFDLAAPDLFASLTSSNALLQLFQID